MMSDLNTIVQFLAAIYVTITIDNLMFKRFWTPDIYLIVESELSHFDFALSTPKRRSLLDSIKRKANTIDSQSRKRGAYFVLLCISLLILFSFEEYITEKVKAIFYLSLFVSICIAFLLYILGIFCWNRWRSIFVSYSTIVVIFLIIILALPNVEHLNCLLLWSKEYSSHLLLLDKILTLILLTFPLVLRLYINWVNSFVYVTYLNCKLRDEFTAYKTTKDAIKNKNKEGCDSRYDDVYKQAYYSNTEDSVDTGLINKVVDNLVDICKPLNTVALIRYRFSKEFTNNGEIEQAAGGKEYILPKEDMYCLDYSTYLSEYEKMTNVSIEKFCGMRGLNSDAFRKYRKDIMQNKGKNITPKSRPYENRNLRRHKREC